MNHTSQPRKTRFAALTGATVLCGAMLASATPAQAESGDPLRIESATLRGHGEEVRVRVSYHCEEGLSAGVGIFLSQENRSGQAVSGGAGSGQRPCTGETETVTLTLAAGSGHFSARDAAISVSLFTSGPGTADSIEQRTDTIRLQHRDDS